MPGEAAQYTVVDPDMNRNPLLAETLDVSADNIIPTVIIGEPKTLEGVNIPKISICSR